MTNQNLDQQAELIELAMKFMAVRRAKDFQRYLSRHTDVIDMTTERPDDNSGVLESSRTPAEALRQQLVKMRVYTTTQNTEDGKHWLYSGDVETIMELVTAYAATVEREAETKARLDELANVESIAVLMTKPTKTGNSVEWWPDGLWRSIKDRQAELEKKVVDK